MKCEHCGAPIGLEDKFCAYCGAPNPHALKHQADMEHYEREFQKTQTEVMKSTGRMARISSNLIILAILVILNIGAFFFAVKAPDLAWDAREKAQEKRADEYRADLEELIEAKEYLKLYSYYNSNHISAVDSLYDYSAVCRAAGCYQNIYTTLCGRKNLGYGSIYSNLSGLSDYDVEYLASEVERLYAIENEYYGAKISERDQAVIEEIREYAEAIFLGYTTLTKEQVEELSNVSKSRAMEMIREEVTIRE